MIDNNATYKVDRKSTTLLKESDEAFPVPRMMTLESPKQILTEDYPEQKWPFHGCWGYDENTPTVIDLDTECEGDAFEGRFVYFRTIEELNGRRSDEDAYAGIQVDKVNQFLYKIGNRYFDEVEYEVTAISLKNSERISYGTIGYFDITNFFWNE